MSSGPVPGNGPAALQEAFSGRYRILRQIGAGGMATVYLADDLQLGRQVAVKILKPDLAATVALDRFRREIQIAAGLNHPHILPLLDGGKAGDFVYYVMPYVEGDSLRDRLKRGALSFGEAVGILHDVVDALDHAHSKGVVHRDIKPENILLSGRHALVTDFGVAKALAAEADSTTLTSVGLAIGTPSYMAPEQVMGRADIDHRADLYSAGVLGYELLTGKTPFGQSSVQGVMAAHLVEVPAPLSTAGTPVPTDLAAVIMKCLEKSADDRWQTSHELLARLQAYAGRDTSSHAVPLARSRHIRMAAVVTAATVIGAAGFWVSSRLRTPGAPVGATVTDRIIVLPFEMRSTDPELEGAGNVVAEWITQGLHREEIGHAVPSATIAQMLRSSDGDVGDAITALIDFTHAGLLVSGSVSRSRDTVVVQAEIVDPQRDRIVQSIDPARATSLSAAVDIARGRVLGGIAAYLGFGEPSLRQAPPPTVEVFREFFAGREAFAMGDFAEAERRFDRIAKLDSTYVSQVSLQAGVLYWTGRFAEAESLVVRVLRRPERLTPFERASVEYIQAWITGDLEAEYRTAVARGGLDPSLVYNVANSALRSNRPADAMRAFESVDMDSPFARQLAVLWAIPPVASHMLGRHEDELEFATRAREIVPNDLSFLNLHIAALAALGRTDELAGEIDGSRDMRAPFEVPPLDTPGWSALLAALELTAHGHGSMAPTFYRRAIDWYAEQLGAAPNDLDLRYGMALAYYGAGEWDSARGVVGDLLTAQPDELDYVGLMGVIAIRMGDGESARDMERRLDAAGPAWLFGRELRWKARMAALSGDTTRAFDLLRSAYGRGISLSFGQDWNWLHTDPDLDAVRAYAPFRAWSAPNDSS